MPIAFEIQQGMPCVFTNLPNLTNIVTGYHRSSISEISQVSQQLFTLRKTEDSNNIPTLKHLQPTC